MDVNNNFRLEEELFGTEGGRQSAGEWSSDMAQETAAKQTRKRPREPTVKIEEKKKMGSKRKVGKGPVEWVRPLYLHDESYRLVQCSLHLRLLFLEKRGPTLFA